MRKKLILLAIVISPLFLMAQPNTPGGPPCEGDLGGPGFGEPCIPIDGGISLLIAAGLAYGGKKALDSRKK